MMAEVLSGRTSPSAASFAPLCVSVCAIICSTFSEKRGENCGGLMNPTAARTSVPPPLAMRICPGSLVMGVTVMSITS